MLQRSSDTTQDIAEVAELGSTEAMDLDDLRAFIAVADTGSFSAAARSLNFARNTLSRRVDELEARSGVQLLKRAADTAKMTRAGEILAEKGRSILKETKQVFDAVRSLEHQSDLLTIEVPVGLPPSVEQTAHRTFRKAAPSLRFRVRYTDGRFDPHTDATFAFHAGHHEPGDGWYHNRIAKIHTGLLATESYLEQHGRPASLEDLKKHSLLVWERHDCDPLILPSKSHSGGFPIDPVLVSPSAHLIRKFAVSGDGIAFMPTSRISKIFEEESLVGVLEEEVSDVFEVWMAIRSDAQGGAIGILAQAIARFAQSMIIFPQKLSSVAPGRASTPPSE